MHTPECTKGQKKNTNLGAHTPCVHDLGMHTTSAEYNPGEPRDACVMTGPIIDAADKAPRLEKNFQPQSIAAESALLLAHKKKIDAPCVQLCMLLQSARKGAPRVLSR